MSFLSFLSETVASGIAAAVPSCIGSVSEYLAYPFKVSDNMKALDVATNNLVAAQADVKNRVESAELQGLTQNNQVGEWLGRVEEVKGEVDEIRKRFHGRTWCLGTQLFNCWSNYWISRDAIKGLQEVQKLCDNNKFEEVAAQLPPQVQEFPVGSEVVPKEEVDCQRILRYINNDQYDIIGIWGMGGVGKTHLLQLVHNSCKGSSAFDVVLFVTASREYSVEKIQAELCDKYGFGRGTSVESQAVILSNYLSNRNFLILVDDVWDKIDLQRVGIPIVPGLHNQFKRKIIITTRSESACGMMGVKKTLRVLKLDTKDALRLFHENVGDETINSHPQIPSLALEIVKELDGLPLALTTIGRSMYGKRDPNEWEHAIDLLRKSRLNEIEIMREEEKIYYQLKFSYDSLESTELRNCFLACCLWPEDCRIHKNDLVECWMGLGLLDAFDAPNIYNLGYTLIGKLLSACLLEQDIIIPDRVKMHDIIRDMAVWLAHDFGKERNKWIMRTGAGVDQVLHEKDRWCHAERATLYVEEQTLANQPIPCQANKLLFLVVHYYKYDGTTAGTLVKHLKFFCTLTFLDLSRCKLISVPQGISSLVNLRHLDLSYNKINSVPEELKFCRNLRCLFLGDNCIASFPMGVISELKMLLVLNLFRIDGAKDQEIFPIDPNIIHGEKKWEFLDWLIKEIKCLDNIRSLGITLKHGTHFESILQLPNLPIRFLELDFVNEIDTLLIPGSFIGDSRIQDNLYILHLRVKSARRIVIECQYESTHCHLKCLEFLRLSGMEMLEEIIWQNLVPHDLFLRLYILRIEYCRNLKDVSWTLYLPCLTSFGIHSCDSIIRLFEHFGLASAAEERAVTPTFPSLKQLSLSGLPKLQIICEQSIMFPCLEYIGIRCCPMLKKLPFQSNTAISKLRAIHTETDCWERLEWEDHEIKQSLQPFMKFDDFS